MDNHSSLARIIKCVKQNKVLWTAHVDIRLRERKINRNFLFDSADTFEIIKCYPADRRLPCFLIYAEHGELKLHFVIAYNEIEDNIKIITAYIPDIKEWLSDYKTRRKYCKRFS